MKKINRIFLIALCFVFGLSLLSCKEDSQNSISKQELIEKVKYGVVEIASGDLVGSGAIIKADKNGTFIVTNYHVIAGLSKSDLLTVRFGDDQLANASIEGYLTNYDLAILKTDYYPKKVYVFDLEAKKDVDNQIGQDVLSVGYVGGDFCVFNGIISADSKLVSINIQNKVTNLFCVQTTAISPTGTSGGPCFDLYGNLVGLNAFSNSVNNVLTGISYKIPKSIIKAVFDRVLKADENPFSLSAGFIIQDDGKIDITCFDKVFAVKLINKKLTIVSSENPDFAVGGLVSKVNGFTADVFSLFSQLILTMDNTVIDTI